jgi:hypothetical protein
MAEETGDERVSVIVAEIRDLYAAAALTGVIQSEGAFSRPAAGVREQCEMAFGYADWMIKLRELSDGGEL